MLPPARNRCPATIFASRCDGQPVMIDLPDVQSTLPSRRDWAVDRAVVGSAECPRQSAATELRAEFTT